MPPTALRFFGLASCQIASAAAGRANIMIGKKPVMKAPAVGSPCEEAGDVAVHDRRRPASV